MAAAALRPSRVILLSLSVGVFFTAQAVLMALTAGRPIRLEWDVLQELLYWVVWALLAPQVLSIAQRWPLDAKPLRKQILAHVFASVLFASVQTIIAFGLHEVVLWIVGEVSAADLSRWMMYRGPVLVWGVFMGVMFYWLVIGVYTALRFQQLYTTERLAAAELAGRSATLEAELAHAQLDALRSQLRPHFLFNTLNAISVLTSEDPAKARRMLLQLSSLLRRSLDEEQHEVSLRQELTFLNEYLDIQRVRFGDKLVVRLGIEPAASEARVPVLLLQPLVENAIEHGAPAKEGVTAIELRALRSGDTLRLTVEDNGPGPGEPNVLREGIGLRNTRERLQKLYGESATLTLAQANGSVGGTGTRVDIVIPFHQVTT